MHFQHCLMRGKIVSDLRLHEVDNGQKKTVVLNFDLQVNEPVRTSQGNKFNSTRLKCCMWDSGAETVYNNSVRGDDLIVIGSIRDVMYEKDGQRLFRKEFRVHKFNFVTPKQSNYYDDVDDNDVVEDE
jgi:single-stranded DNA-binding protein